MKNRYLTLTLALSLVSSTTKPSSYTPSLSTICYAGVCALIGAGLYAYSSSAVNSVNTLIEQKIVEQASNDLYLTLTFNTIIERWKEPMRSQAFCRKAALIDLRKNVLKKLEVKLPTLPESVLKTRLLAAIVTAKGLFAITDELRSTTSKNELIRWGRWQLQRLEIGKQLLTPNPCEGKNRAVMLNSSAIQETFKQYLLNPFIEDRIVASILLSFKPEGDCTATERVQKKVMQERRKLIVQQAAAQLGRTYAGISQFFVPLTNEEMLYTAALFIPLYEENKQ